MCTQFSYDTKVFIPIGTEGVIGATHIPVVRNTREIEFFNCVDVMIDGKSYRGIYYDNEIIEMWEKEEEIDDGNQA